MADVSLLRNNFTAGELTPLMRGRSDHPRYHHGAETIHNCFVLPEGGVTFRHGTRYVGATKFRDSLAIFLPFEPSTTDVYQLLVGHLYIWIYKDETRLGTVELTTPYTAAQLRAIRTAQANDVMVLVHGSHAPRRLSRLSDTSWSFATIRLDPPATYVPGSAPSATLTPSAVSGAITLTASVGAFVRADVDRQLQAGDARVVITGYSSTTVVLATVLDAFADTSAIAAGGWTILKSPVARCKPSKAEPIGAQVELVLQLQQDEAAELVTNGAFTTDLTGWTVVGGSTTVIAQGWHDGSVDSADLVDSAADFLTAGVGVGHRVFNTIDGSEGIVSVVTATQIVLNPALAGGTDNDWDNVAVAESTGTDNSGVNNKTTSMTDTTTDFVADNVLVGMTIQNTTDSSSGVVTSISTTTNPNDTVNFSAGLTGGTDNDFDNGDGYTISHPGDRYVITDTGSAIWKDGKARLNGNTNGVGGVRQSLTTVAQTFYRLVFDVLTAPVSVMVGSTAGGSDITAEASYAVANEHEIIFQATSTTTWIEVRNNQQTPGDVDNISCKLYSVAGWRGADVGKYVYLNGGLVKLSTITDAQRATGEILTALTTDQAAAIGAWTLEASAWSDALGWPEDVILQDGRLLFGGSATFPDKVWESEVDGLFNFARGVNPDDAVTLSITQSGGNISLNKITWLLPFDRLVVGTTHAEYALIGSNDDPISPTNLPRVRLGSAIGSAAVKPVLSPHSILFVERSASTLYELQYNPQRERFDTRDLMIIAEHLLGETYTILQVVYHQKPVPTVSVVSSEGTLLLLTYDLVENVIGWAKLTLAGTNAMVESVSVNIHPTKNASRVWVAAQRTEGRWVEYFDIFNPVDPLTGQAGNFLDAAVIGTFATPTATITGLDHLNGQVIDVVGDGGHFAGLTVAGGQVTLPQSVSTYSAGLPYTGTLKPLPPDIPQVGTIRNRQKRVVEAGLILHETVAVKVNGERLKLLTDGMLANQGPVPFTGTQSVMPLGWGRDAPLTITFDTPFQGTVLGVLYELDIEDEG